MLCWILHILEKNSQIKVKPSSIAHFGLFFSFPNPETQIYLGIAKTFDQQHPALPLILPMCWDEGGLTPPPPCSTHTFVLLFIMLKCRTVWCRNKDTPVQYRTAKVTGLRCWNTDALMPKPSYSHLQCIDCEDIFYINLQYLSHSVVFHSLHHFWGKKS